MTTLRATPIQPTVPEPTPYWAWELHHGRGLDVARTATRLGISRHDVLHLLGVYKPVAAAMEMQRMKNAQEPRIDQVDPRARETYVQLGTLLGIPDPRTATWDGVAARIAARIGAAYFVDGDTLWLWSAEARTEDDERASAIGIRTIPGGRGHYGLLDGHEREIGMVTTLKAAEVVAARKVRLPSPMQAAA